MKEFSKKIKKLFFKNITFCSYLIIILILGIFAVPRIFAEPQAVKSVEIYSERLNYMDKEPGSWKVTKSAKWKEKGIAEITFDVNSILKSMTKYTDVLFVLDISGSMHGEKLDRVKYDSTQLIENLLSNENNSAGLITFETNSEIVLPFTNDKDNLVSAINSLETGDMTNYHQALVNVDSVLKEYVKEKNRECIVLFLTDGYPNEETPNEEGQYSYLKDKYPFITINGIQYEMGDSILAPLEKVTDSQYIANMDNLDNILFEAAISSIPYKNFEITDYIDTNYFYVESESDIKVSQGSIIFDKDNQKFTWKMDSLKSGLKAKMTIKAKLKDELIGEGGLYPTNEKESIKSEIDDNEEDITSSKTPVLTNNYMVIYDGNAPDDCRVEGVPLEKQYSVFDTVAVSDSVPKCEGYQFKGWDIRTENVGKVNDDYFIMPEKNVVISAKWGKLSVEKSTEGKIIERQTLYDLVKQEYELGNSVRKYTGETDTFIGNEDVYYYYGNTTTNNILFGGFCWKMIRTTDTGGVKIVYSGTPDSKGNCPNEFTSIGTGLYNSKVFLSDAGYMFSKRYEIYYKPLNDEELLYGNNFLYKDGVYSLSNSKLANYSLDVDNLNNHHYTCWDTTGVCQKISYIFYSDDTKMYYLELESGVGIDEALNEMLNVGTDASDSELKKKLDKWYADNMIKFSSYLEDTVWCNDKSIKNYDISGWNPNGGSNRNRLNFGASSGLECINENDRFTVSKNNGNGALTYPIGLLTINELKLSYHSSTDYLFVSSGRGWTFSPMSFFGNIWIYFVENGFVRAATVPNATLDIYPSISLRKGIKYSDGTGTVDNPYIIDMKS